MNQLLKKLHHRLPWILIMSIVGAFGFVWIQTWTGGGNIAEFVGNRTVAIGGYPDHYAGPIGWTTHFVISFAYTLLAASIASMPFFPAQAPKNLVASIVLGLAIGWGTTLIANPAIVVTCNVLAMNSPFASDLLELGIASKPGVPLWNHLWFFTAAFLLTGVVGKERVPMCQGSIDPSTSGLSSTATLDAV